MVRGRVKIGGFFKCVKVGVICMMNPKTEHLPVYSLHNFSSPERKSQQFQVEVFDAKRHFSVKYPHRHDFFEVLYLMKGSGFHVIDSNKYEINHLLTNSKTIIYEKYQKNQFFYSTFWSLLFCFVFRYCSVLTDSFRKLIIRMCQHKTRISK